MEKSIEMRVAELEKQVFHTKNVLSCCPDECFLRKGRQKCKTQIIKTYKICLLHEFQAEEPEKAEFDGSCVTKS